MNLREAVKALDELVPLVGVDVDEFDSANYEAKEAWAVLRPYLNELAA